MNRKTFFSASLCASAAMLILNVGYARAQTPGQIPIFDQPGTGFCNSSAGSDCIDSVITQDANENVGIGTATPAARLDVAGGDLNLDDSVPTAGKILKGGVPFIHSFGTDNTFIGKNAGNLTMSGASNTAGGSFALFSNTTGTSNTANRSTERGCSAAAMKADAEAVKGENAHLKARLEALERSIANATFTRAE